MTRKQPDLCERLKRMGFKHENQIRLYGQRFQLQGEPMVLGDGTILMDAVDTKCSAPDSHPDPHRQHGRCRDSPILRKARCLIRPHRSLRPHQSKEFGRRPTTEFCGAKLAFAARID